METKRVNIQIDLYKFGIFQLFCQTYNFDSLKK